MAMAFVEHLAGRKVAQEIRASFEVVETGAGDDPFAVVLE